MDETFVNAVACVQIGNTKSGTGFLVTKDLVLTALHVIADRKKTPIEPYGEIFLKFKGFNTFAEMTEYNLEADWVLLRCKNAPAIKPLVLRLPKRSNVVWRTYGFPDMNPCGMYVMGEVRAIRGNFFDEKINQQVEAIQLFAKEAVEGALVSGISGAPVVVNDSVVGIVRYALMQDVEAGIPRAQTLYATNIALVTEENEELGLLPSLLQRKLNKLDLHRKLQNSLKQLHQRYTPIHHVSVASERYIEAFAHSQKFLREYFTAVENVVCLWEKIKENGASIGAEEINDFEATWNRYEELFACKKLTIEKMSDLCEACEQIAIALKNVL